MGGLGAFGAIGFTTPWLLLGLLALPILWLLLRAVPPAPIRRRFPGIALLLGLRDDESQSDRTPWWLLLLRSLAVAALIIGFAGPILNPQADRGGQGPLLILADGTWADAPGWNRRLDRIEGLLTEAGRAGRPVALALLSDLPAGGPEFQSAEAWRKRLAGLTPQPWTLPMSEEDPSGAAGVADWVRGQGETASGFDTYWLSDGLARDARADILDSLSQRGAVTVFEGGRNVQVLEPPVFDTGAIRLTARRLFGTDAAEAGLTAFGLDPARVERALATGTARFAAGETSAQIALSLPPELRNRITRFQLDGQRSAGAVTLTDDALKRREVGMLAGGDAREALQLLAPLHYLRQALEPTADLIDGTLGDMLLANPDVIILADMARIPDGDAEALQSWIEAGGLLLRFAGPRLAASDVARDAEDPFLPVRLRVGGRTVGGAMSWGTPKSLRAFDRDSPFFGLTLPDEVRVNAQVMAQPDPDLPQRVIAALEDGTPLVTRRPQGEGQIVLFHVTANAEWSTLPLSGLFVEMLERLAVSTRPSQPDAEELAGTVWTPQSFLNGFGERLDATDAAGVDGARLAGGGTGPDMPPGLYAGGDRQIAVNAVTADTPLAPVVWPADVRVEGLVGSPEQDLKALFLMAALALLLTDVLASLWIGGRLAMAGQGRAGAILVAVALGGAGGAGGAVATWPGAALAQTSPQTPGGDLPTADARAIQATSEVVLAHVLTGDTRVDDVARAGLRGLSQTLFQRTSIEPADPIAVNLETDELAFYPFLYWPVAAAQPLPSPAAYARLNRYLRSGGMILFDTRDADIGGFGSATPEGRKLRQIAAPLDVPPLEPVPRDHVLTRTFYLLQDFPGRHTDGSIWVEAAPPDAEQAEGMPFRNLNDGVTPVVIGGNDWGAAWATDQAGNRMFRIGSGFAGERQREMALRFGVNLLMHVLTGNYKSDQVHVPALLDRLGQ